MKQLVLHSLKMHKVQSVSIAVSVALSVMILLTLGLVYGGVMQGIDASEKRGGADIMAVPTDSLQYLDNTELLYTGAPAPIYMSQDIVEKIAAADGVQQISPQFFGQTLNSGCCSTTGETRLIGIDPETDFVVSALVGEDAVKRLDGHSVIVGSGVGGVFNDELTIYSEKYDVIGVMAETGTEFDVSIVGDIDLVRGISRDMEGYEHYWEKYGDPSGLVSCVMVDVVDDETGAALTSVQARINLSGQASPLVRSEIVDKSRSQLQSVFLLLLVAGIIMAVVTLLQLFARFFSSVWDRKSELALYRAIGASKSDLRKLIVGEVGLLVGAGLIVGVVLGFAAQALLLGVMQDGLAFPYVALGIGPVIALVVGIVVVFALVCLLSIIWPLNQIGRLDPSMAMQQGDID